MKESKVANGRIAVYVPDHPGANNRGYVPKARYVVEQSIGRLLDPSEQIHHRDGDKFNNCVENLEIMSCEDHAKLHGGKRELDYSAIKDLMIIGLGYKRIAKQLCYKTSSTKSACRVIRKENNWG